MSEGYAPPPHGYQGNYGYYYPPPFQWYWYNGRWYNTPHAEDGRWLVQEDRTMAMLANLLAIFSGFIGPMIMYFVKKDKSKFVAFHALQAMFFALGMMLLQMANAAVQMHLMFKHMSSPSHMPFGAWGDPAYIISIVLSYIIMFGAIAYYIVVTVSAYRGKWRRYFLAWRPAAKIVERSYGSLL